MRDALYGADGFYRSSGAPARHFRTAAHTSPLWAAAMAELARRVDAALGEPAGFCVVDVGAGGGELLGALSGIAPDRWALIGVDVADRPTNLPERVQWSTEPPRGVTGLLVAVEWLDVVPVDVVELAGEGPRLVEVADDGDERLGALASGEDAGWLQQWWALADVGDRAEIGRSRDEAWGGLVERTLSRGVALAVDYAADPVRDVAGTMTAYRDGRQMVPVPDGSCDITAHVLMESCAAGVTEVDGTQLLTQRDALRALGLAGERPSYDGDPQGYVAALSQASAAAELLDPHGLGSFAWLLHARALDLHRLLALS
jgi:SAM-dependent MidA family methyltransferase